MAHRTNRTEEMGHLARGGRGVAKLEPLFLAIVVALWLFPNRWAPLGLIPLLLPWIGRLLWQRRLTRRSPLNAPALIILLMAIVGYAVSVDRGLSWAKLWGIALQVGVFFAVLNNVRGPRARRWAILILLLGTAAVALLALLGTNWQNVRLLPLPALYERLPQVVRGIPGSGLPRTTDLFSVREVGLTMAFLLPAPLALALGSSSRRLRLAAALVALLAAAVLLLTQALSAFLGLAVALAFMALCWRRRTLAVILPAFLAFLVILPFLGLRRLALALLDLDNVLGVGIVLRLDMWNRALAMLGDLPLTGIGLNTFPLIQSHFYPGLLIGPEPHAHNLFLQTALDLGLPGLLAFLWLVAAFFVVAYRAHRRAAQRALLVGLAACILSYLAGGLFDVVTLGAKPPAALWFIMGLVAALEQESGRPTPAPGGALTGAAGLLLLLLALAVAAVLVTISGVASGNLGSLQAHRALFGARNGRPLPGEEAYRARAHLEEALRRRPRDAHFHGLLGSLSAWQGDHAEALASFQRRVSLDGPRALQRYGPFVAWQRALQDEAKPELWAGTVRVYRTWQNRFPTRAENYALEAIVRAQYLGEPRAATTVLQRGMARGAQPAGMLRWYLQLE